jgi:hypothetical protein
MPSADAALLERPTAVEAGAVKLPRILRLLAQSREHDRRSLKALAAIRKQIEEQAQ